MKDLLNKLKPLFLVCIAVAVAYAGLRFGFSTNSVYH